MHEVIMRYAKRVRGINNASLAIYRRSPNFVREAIVYSAYHLRKNKLPKTRFVIFAQGRTGSTVLVDLMNSHPDIASLGEIMTEDVIRNVRYPRKFAEGLCSLSKKPACGFKVKVYQIEKEQGHDPAVVLKDFQENGWKIIYLVRTNLLRHAVSDVRSEKTGLFHVVDKTGEVASKKGPRGKIRIEWDELLKAMQFRETCLEKEARALEPLPHLTIEYEKDLLEPEAKVETMNRVFDYLELPRHDAKTDFKKVTAKNIADNVENFDELEAELQKTHYAQFLGWG